MDNTEIVIALNEIAGCLNGIALMIIVSAVMRMIFNK